VLYRLPFPVPLADVHEADAVGTEQPLVGAGDQEVRAYLGDVERQGPERLYGVHHERGPYLPGPPAHPDEVHERAVRPVAVGQRYDGDLFV
jgi:hypothetical protein